MHADHVQTVFELMQQAGLSMKIEKCFFGVKTMTLLGYEFPAQGMTPFPDRCDVIHNFWVPISQKIAQERGQF